MNDRRQTDRGFYRCEIAQRKSGLTHVFVLKLLFSVCIKGNLKGSPLQGHPWLGGRQKQHYTWLVLLMYLCHTDFFSFILNAKEHTIYTAFSVVLPY